MIRFLIVDEFYIVRYGVKSLLETNPDYFVVGEANNLEELCADQNYNADILLMDLSNESEKSLELVKEIRRLSNDSLKVLVFSARTNYLFINQCFKAGVSGYLLKTCKKAELFTAIGKVMKGEIYACHSVSHLLANNYINQQFKSRHKAKGKVDITPREKEIITLISAGLSNREIAQKLLISVSTVDAHRYNILKKIEAKNTAEMIMKALEFGIINSQK